MPFIFQTAYATEESSKIEQELSKYTLDDTRFNLASIFDYYQFTGLNPTNLSDEKDRPLEDFEIKRLGRLAETDGSTNMTELEARRLGIVNRMGFLALAEVDKDTAMSHVHKHKDEILKIYLFIKNRCMDKTSNGGIPRLKILGTNTSQNFVSDQYPTDLESIATSLVMSAVILEKLKLSQRGFTLFDLAAKIADESKFSPIAVSPTGALGISQIVPYHWRADTLKYYPWLKKIAKKNTDVDLYDIHKIDINNRYSWLDNQMAAYGLFMLRTINRTSGVGFSQSLDYDDKIKVLKNYGDPDDKQYAYRILNRSSYLRRYCDKNTLAQLRLRPGEKKTEFVKIPNPNYTKKIVRTEFASTRENGVPASTTDLTPSHQMTAKNYPGWFEVELEKKIQSESRSLLNGFSELERGILLRCATDICIRAGMDKRLKTGNAFYLFTRAIQYGGDKNLSLAHYSTIAKGYLSKDRDVYLTPDALMKYMLASLRLMVDMKNKGKELTKNFEALDDIYSHFTTHLSDQDLRALEKKILSK